MTLESVYRPRTYIGPLDLLLIYLLWFRTLAICIDGSMEKNSLTTRVHVPIQYVELITSPGTESCAVILLGFGHVDL
jgi:hypothetical protein